MTPLQATARAAFTHFSQPLFDLVIRDQKYAVAEIPVPDLERRLWMMRKLLPESTEVDLTAMLADAMCGSESDVATISNPWSAELESSLSPSDLHDFKDMSGKHAKQRAADVASFLVFMETNKLNESCSVLFKKLGSSLKDMLEVTNSQVREAAETARKPRVAVPAEVPAEKPDTTNTLALKKPLALDVANLNLMLPKSKGCGFYEFAEERKVQVKYPAKPNAPHSRSRSWSAVEGAGFSRQQVIVHCMHWVWDAHTRTTGEQCPWDLGVAGDYGLLA